MYLCNCKRRYKKYKNKNCLKKQRNIIAKRSIAFVLLISFTLLFVVKSTHYHNSNLCKKALTEHSEKKGLVKNDCAICKFILQNSTEPNLQTYVLIAPCKFYFTSYNISYTVYNPIYDIKSHSPPFFA